MNSLIGKMVAEKNKIKGVVNVIDGSYEINKDVPIGKIIHIYEKLIFVEYPNISELTIYYIDEISILN